MANSIGTTEQSGQSLLEFILLLALIIGLSLGLFSLSNRQLAKTWKSMANKLTGPSAQQPTSPVEIR